jgi:hypothetical protein
VKGREERTAGGEASLLSGLALRVGAGGDGIWRNKLHSLMASMQDEIKEIREAWEDSRATCASDGQAQYLKAGVRRLQEKGLSRTMLVQSI